MEYETETTNEATPALLYLSLPADGCGAWNGLPGHSGQPRYVRVQWLVCAWWADTPLSPPWSTKLRSTSQSELTE